MFILLFVSSIDLKSIIYEKTEKPRNILKKKNEFERTSVKSNAGFFFYPINSKGNL